MKEFKMPKSITRTQANEDALSHQNLLINYIIEKNCNSLIIAPNKNFTSKKVKELKNLGYKIVVIDRPSETNVDSVIRTDNFAAGKLAALKLSEALGGHGDVALFRFSKQVSSTSQRAKGFIEGAKQGGLSIKADLVLGTTIGKIRDNYIKWLKKGIKVEGMFTTNESTTLGVLLTNLTSTEKVSHIGFDFHKEYLVGLKQGKLIGFISQDPIKMGYLAAVAINKLYKNEPVEKHMSTPVVFINRTNVDNKEIKEILNLEN